MMYSDFVIGFLLGFFSTQLFIFIVRKRDRNVLNELLLLQTRILIKELKEEDD